MPKKTMNPHIEAWARDYWEQALVQPAGLEVEFYSKKEAEAFRFGLYRARNVDRTLNREIYPEGDALHGASAWDHMLLKLVTTERGTFSILIQPSALAAPKPKSITPLTEDPIP